jgi:hypothetical protein
MMFRRKTSCRCGAGEYPLGSAIHRTGARRSTVLLSTGTRPARTWTRTGRANATPGRGSASVRWEPWSAMRTGASTVLGWQVGIAAEPLHELTILSARSRRPTCSVSLILKAPALRRSISRFPST